MEPHHSLVFLTGIVQSWNDVKASSRI